MDPEQAEPKDRILQVAIELLRQGRSAQQITIREIAERADVGIGLINYYYQSKDILLNAAFDRIFGEDVYRWLDPSLSAGADARTRLRKLIQASGDIALANTELARIGLSYALTRGDMSVSLMILPILREIYAGQKDELTLRLLAITLIHTLQSILLKMEAVEGFLGINLKDPLQRNALIDQLIDQILNIP